LSEVEDPTEEKRLAYMKSRREYADVLRTRAETERLNPSMIKGERNRPSLGERLKKTTDDMIEAKHSYDLSQKMFGNGGDSTQSRQWTTQQALDFAKYLASIGKSPEEIQRYITKLGATLDLASSTDYRNPFAQNYLMAATSERERWGVKDFTDAVSVIKSLQQPQNGSDTASIISALGNFIAATKGNSSDLATIQGLYQQMTSQQQASFDRHLELVRERASEQPSFQDQLQQIVTLQTTLGKLGPGKESETIQTRRLELDHEKWKANLDAETEKRKSQGQMDMVKQITGGLSRALEAPVVKEFGKSVGRQIGLDNPLSGVQTRAAQEQVKALSNPLAAERSFSCPKCHQTSYFTNKDLLAIAESHSGKWVCPGCSEPYQLKNDDQRKDEGGTTVA